MNFFDLKEEKLELLNAFKAIDSDNNGVITVDELEKFIGQNGERFGGKSA